MTQDINWPQLYDRLSERYGSLERTLVEIQKRLDQVRADVRQQTRKELLLQLLPIADDIVYAQKAALSGCERETLAEAIGFLQRRVDDILVKEGVSPVDATPGEPFDPSVHEAFYLQESDEIAADAIVEQVRRGYVHEEKLLRAALVAVSKGKAA